MKSEKVKYFLKILKIELDAFDEELKTLEEFYKDRLSKDEITPYVFLENRALLEKEFGCINCLQKKIDNFSVENEMKPDSFLAAFMEFVHNIAEKNHYPGVIEKVVRMKAQKVLRYVEESPV